MILKKLKKKDIIKTKKTGTEDFIMEQKRKYEAPMAYSEFFSSKDIVNASLWLPTDEF